MLNINNFLIGRIVRKNKFLILVFIKKKIFLKKYNKKIFYFSKIWCYDMFLESEIGDLVMVVKSRPISKTVSWILCKILEKVRLI